MTSANAQTDAKLTGTANPGFGNLEIRHGTLFGKVKWQIHEDGWTVEMKIPYLSLRFSKKDVQTWGMQFLRYMRRNNEQNFWNTVDPNINGFVNQFGKYADLKNIQPPLRLSFYPYLSTGVGQMKKETIWVHNGYAMGAWT